MSNVKTGTASGTALNMFSFAFVKSLFAKEDAPATTPAAEAGVASDTTATTPVADEPVVEEAVETNLTNTVYAGLAAYGLEKDMTLVAITEEQVNQCMAALGNTPAEATSICCARVAMEKLDKDSDMYKAAEFMLEALGQAPVSAGTAQSDKPKKKAKTKTKK